MKRDKAALLLLAAFCGVLVGAPVRAQVPAESAVRSAISRLLARPAAGLSDDLALVTRFAEKSDKVQVEITKGLVGVPNGEKDALLLGYFIVGSVQHDLAHPEQARHPVADKVSAVKASLVMYRALQKRDKRFKRPLMDKLATLEKQGRLPQYVRSAMRDNDETR